LPYGFPIKIRPTFKTTIGVVSSGREVRWGNQTQGLWEIELLFEVLRDQTQNQTVYSENANITNYMQLCQFFLMNYGQLGVFLFDAFWDNSRTAQPIGTGDGVTTEFTAIRTWGVSGGYLNEYVGAINNITEVTLDGNMTGTDTYTFSGNTLIFNTPPANDVAIAMTFSFYYLCSFITDAQDFEEFYKNIWQVGSLKFRSIPWPWS